MIRYKILILILIIFQSSKDLWAINPEKKYVYSPRQYGITEYDSVFLETSDQYKIFTCLFKPSKNWNNKTIIIAYGDAGNMSYCYYHVYRFLRLGYKVITFDYRGFGKSQDFVIDKKMLFYTEYIKDMQSVINYAKQDSTNQEIGIIAFSMGTIITTYIVNENKIDFIIGENYVTDVSKVIERIKLNYNEEVFKPKEVTYNKYAKMIKNIDMPLLIFSGSKDKITMIEDVKLLSQYNEKCDQIIYDNDHGMALSTLSNSYFDEIEGFIKKNNL